MGGRDRDPGALSPRDAVERYLRRRQADATDASVKSYKYRLKLFVEWLEGIGIDRVDEIRGYDLDEYYGLRSGNIAPATLQGEMQTLLQFAEYLEQIDAVDDLADSVRVPNVDKDEMSDDVSLEAGDAIPLLAHYRDSEVSYGSRAHVLIELAWFTGARQGGLRGLDLRDFYPDQQFVEFRHRPSTDTPLKNKSDAERPVGIPNSVVEVLEEYVNANRYDVVDDHNRAPLLASMRGRPTENTLRGWSYLATQPCLHLPCPHDQQRETCEFVDYNHASKCPSSRSPHQIRTGSITWQLDSGLPPSVVAERVNSRTETIKKHYDVATPRERMEQRRRPYLGNLEIDNDDSETDD
jgi:site-specific recombinase XerD